MAEIKAYFIEASSDCISETNEYPYAVVGGSVPSGKLPTDTPAAEVFCTIIARHKEVGGGAELNLGECTQRRMHTQQSAVVAIN